MRKEKKHSQHLKNEWKRKKRARNEGEIQDLRVRKIITSQNSCQDLRQIWTERLRKNRGIAWPC